VICTTPPCSPVGYFPTPSAAAQKIGSVNGGMTPPSAIMPTVPGMSATLAAQRTTALYLCVRMILVMTYDTIVVPCRDASIYLSGCQRRDENRCPRPDNAVGKCPPEAN
jgi:hypothetical protein